MYYSIVSVRPIEDYVLQLIFENKEKRLFDMKPFLNQGKYTELKDEKMFRSARVSFDSIEWSNGVDIDPEILYEKSALVK